MTFVVAAVLGAFGWSFTEYAMHNWVGHLTRGRTEFSREHLTHHRKFQYFTPTRKKVGMALPVVGALLVLSVLAVGIAHGVVFTVAFAAAYVGYEVLHYRIHVAAPRTAFGRWARHHHLAHHHRSPRSNHGVTSPLWDWVFRTWEPGGQVSVPVAKADPWMLQADGSLKPAYAADYALRGRRGSAPAGVAAAGR